MNLDEREKESLFGNESGGKVSRVCRRGRGMNVDEGEREHLRE